jgi:predicted PurR-regulated permease PerM
MDRQDAVASATRVPPIIGFIVAVAILYFARELLIPFALALLFAFLLSPIVKRLELLRIPRMLAALLVFLTAFAICIAIGWVVTNQLVQIVDGLPRYSDNVHRKMVALQGQSGGINKVINSVEDLGKEFTNATQSPKVADKPSSVRDASNPLPVQIIEPRNSVQSVRDFASGAMRPLGTAGIAIVFTIFMLLDQEDLRNRLLRLIGERQLHTTTKAMDDAAARISRYILMQFLVNAGFGTIVALGLYLIGVQSPLLWGVLAMMLRFLSYIGPVIAGAMPIILTLAVTDGWRTPAFVFGLFVVTELITGNFLEPMLYGVHTGLSAVAILVAAVFWTVLWGPIGLILSTPLTVCLSVLGRYSPQLEFLNILLGDEPVLSPDAIFYQRLLALDQHDAFLQLDHALKEKPLITVYDEIIIPALSKAEQDRHSGMLEAKREEFLVQNINEFITELGELNRTPVKPGKQMKAGEEVRQAGGAIQRVICVPANDVADEIAAAMFAQLVNDRGFPALAFPVTDSPAALIESLGIQAGDVVVISSVPPLALAHARKLTQEVRETLPDATVIVGLWNYRMNAEKSIERLQESLASVVATTMTSAMDQLIAVSQDKF